LKLTGLFTCSASTFPIITLGNVAAAAVADAPAAFVTDFVIAAIPATAKTAEAVAAYLRKSLRASSGATPSSPEILSAPSFHRRENTIKALSKTLDLSSRGRNAV